MTHLALEGVGFVYPDGTRALSGVDLTIVPGEVVAIVGQNGSGKSTLVRHLDGLLRPTEGRVLHDGADVADARVAALAAAVGIVFQNPDRQIFAGRVRTEVEFGPRILGRSPQDAAAAATAALELVGLGDLADANPYDLGFSRRKLLALASVLAMDTAVIVLDEPTTGQDARGVARIQRVVEGLVAAGRTVIAISHDMRFVAESFGRVVVMGAGRILLDGSPAEVFGEVRLADARVDLPRGAAGRARGRAAGARRDADRGVARRGAGGREGLTRDPAGIPREASAMLPAMSWPGRWGGRLAALLVVVVAAGCSPANPSPSPAPASVQPTDVAASAAASDRPSDSPHRRRRAIGQAGRLDRLRRRVQLRRDPRPARLRRPDRGLSQRLDHPVRGHQAGQADRLAAGQPGRPRRLGRRVRARQPADLPEGGPRAVRHRRVRPARGQLEHRDPLHRQPRRPRRARSVAGRRGRARGAGRFGPCLRRCLRAAGTTRPSPTCRPTRWRGTWTSSVPRSATRA